MIQSKRESLRADVEDQGQALYELKVNTAEGSYVGSWNQMQSLKTLFEAAGHAVTIEEVTDIKFDDIPF